MRRIGRPQRLGWFLWVAVVAPALGVAFLSPHPARAAVTLVNSASANSGTSPVSAAYPLAATAGNLLVAVCSADATATLTAPNGFATAINEAGDPAQAIFYKVATGSELSVSCGFSAGGTGAIQILQYGGIENVSPLNAVTAGNSTGTSGSGSTGSLTTTNANDLLVAALTSDGSSGISAWANSFTPETSGTSGGKPATRISYAAGDLSVSATGGYSTTATVPSGSNWRGQMAAFKIAPAVVFGVDIVDGSGAPIASPSITMSTLPRNFTCQTSTGTLGIAAQKIRVTNSNPANSNGWTLGLAATSGSSETWLAGSSKMDYNDSGGSGCTDSDADGAPGQLSIVPAAEVITAETTPEAGCTITGVSPLSSTTPYTAAQSSVTIANAGSTASHYCYWDITGLSLRQTIPAGQKDGSYSIGLTLTLIAQ